MTDKIVSTNPTNPKALTLEVIKLVNCYLTRPEGQLGNVGSYPFSWIASQATTPERAVRDFERQHNAEIKRYNKFGGTIADFITNIKIKDDIQGAKHIGYGKKIPSAYIAECNDKRTRRIYYTSFSNVGTFFIMVDGQIEVVPGILIDMFNQTQA